MLMAQSPIILTSSPFDCDWYQIEKFLRIHCANGTQPGLETNFIVYYEALSDRYIAQQGMQQEKEYYEITGNLTIRHLFESIFGEPGVVLSYQLESMYMSMVDGSPLPEECDELLNIPIAVYHASHPGASVSFVLYETAVSHVPTDEDDLPTEEVWQMAPISPLLVPAVADADGTPDPIELPPHLLLA
jgi:hypothetical protein